MKLTPILINAAFINKVCGLQPLFGLSPRPLCHPPRKISKGIHLYCLPSHSPELQPAERLWPLTNEPIANRYFSSLDELEAVLYQRCQKLLDLKQLICGLTHFHWWPEPKASLM